jgi:hypothetical protein
MGGGVSVTVVARGLAVFQGFALKKAVMWATAMITAKPARLTAKASNGP